MIIKNILLNDLSFINIIIEELIKYNINYLYIKENNELHLDKYVLRFFDKNKTSIKIGEIFIGLGEINNELYNEKKI